MVLSWEYFSDQTVLKRPVQIARTLLRQDHTPALGQPLQAPSQYLAVRPLPQWRSRQIGDHRRQVTLLQHLVEPQQILI